MKTASARPFRRARALILAGCLFVAAVAAAEQVEVFHWWGIWGSTLTASHVPYHIEVRSIYPGGASDRAGLHVGDLIDVRPNTQLERFWLFRQPMVGVPIELHVLRGSEQKTFTIVPAPISAVFTLLFDYYWPGTIWLMLFAGLIAWRRAHVPALRSLCLVLVFYGLGVVTSPGGFVAPAVVPYVFSTIVRAFSVLAIAFIAMCAGELVQTVSRQLRVAQILTYGLVAVSIVVSLLGVAGTLSLFVDPVSFSEVSLTASLPQYLALLTATACAVFAISNSRGVDRQRAAWTLVPPVLLLGGENIYALATIFSTSYTFVVSCVSFDSITISVVPLILTYVALNHRLLDIGFVLNRAAVFGIVSAVTIGAFILVEWAIGTWLVNASHTTSAIVGMVVALGLGLSMRYVHAATDRFVDYVFFRKRHEDEAALRRFAIECVYITERAALLERTIAVVRKHTGADRVAIFVESRGVYEDAIDGDTRLAVGENDPAIVALKTWHKAVDLITISDSKLEGQFAFPMVMRGVLIGALVCGTKSDDEVYAPDESDALFALAAGVGSTLWALAAERRSSSDDIAAELERLRETVTSGLAELRALYR